MEAENTELQQINWSCKQLKLNKALFRAVPTVLHHSHWCLCRRWWTGEGRKMTDSERERCWKSQIHLRSVWQRGRTGSCRPLLIANILGSCWEFIHRIWFPNVSFLPLSSTRAGQNRHQWTTLISSEQRGTAGERKPQRKRLLTFHLTSKEQM